MHGHMNVKEGHRCLYYDTQDFDHFWSPTLQATLDSK